MSQFIICVCLTAIIQAILVFGVPVQQALPAALIHEFEQTNTGYRFKYEVGDGTIREEIGEHKTLDGKDKPLTVKGHYSYFLDDNSIFTVTYTADENGYNAVLNQTKEQLESFILDNHFSINPNCLKSLCGKK